QHGLQVGVIEGDGLAVRFDGLLAVALQGGDEAEQVVGFGGVRDELERSACRGLGATRVAALYQVPPPIEVRRELIHAGAWSVRRGGPSQGPRAKGPMARAFRPFFGAPSRELRRARA